MMQSDTRPYHMGVVPRVRITSCASNTSLEDQAPLIIIIQDAGMTLRWIKTAPLHAAIKVRCQVRDASDVSRNRSSGQGLVSLRKS